MVLFGLLKTGAVVWSAPRLDSWGRRPMLMSSLSVMTVGLTLVSINLYANSTIPALAIVGVIIYYVGFSVGMGPACWLIPSEVRVRARIEARYFCTALSPFTLLTPIRRRSFLISSGPRAWLYRP